MTNKNLIIAGTVILAALLVSGMIIRNKNSEETSSDSIPNTDLTVPYGTEDNTKNSPRPTAVERGEIIDSNMKQLEKPQMTIDTSKNYKAVVTTSKGAITIDLLEKTAPNTVNNFVYLANNQFYNEVIFHRVLKGFMIQGGDPTGTGTGGPGYTIEDESFTGEYTRGAVAMARTSAPNSAGSQFFIMHADTPLPKSYVIFGQVEKGIEVVDAIAESEVTIGGDGALSLPVVPITILNVEIIVE